MYTVRIYFDSMESIKLADFSEIERGIIRFKAPRDLVINAKSDKNYVNYNGISIDTVINGSSSVGIVWADKELIQISEKKSYIRKGYRKLIGHYDYLRICINNLEGEKFSVDKGSTLFLINFMTERFCELLMSDNTEGLRSSPVEVEVYLNGNLKPYSVKQARSHGLEVVLKPEGYEDIPKFYELDFVDYATNVLDENGNDRPNPLVESVDMESIGYDL